MSLPLPKFMGMNRGRWKRDLDPDREIGLSAYNLHSAGETDRFYISTA
jgi:hypothetical protein